jgi:hypothetical protein
MSASFY